MAKTPSISMVSYAVNGRGLGHLSRQIAIHRWLRRYATFCGYRSQHWFLTTSEADTLLFHEGFAGFKLPSKSAVAEAGIPKPSYLALAKQWIWHSVSLLRPDLFIVDTFPGGSFQELFGVLDLCKHPALVLRPVKPEFARRPSFRALAGLYERVIVPADAQDEEAFADTLDLDPRRVRFVGPIMRGENFERHPRREARARLGVPEDARCVLVSGGGGGDDNVDALFEAAERALEQLAEQQGQAIHVVFAAGPLFRGRPRRGPGRVWWTSPDLPSLLAGFDAAVCAGGFNSVHELAFAKIPTLFVPQAKVADDQHERVRRFVEAGAGLCVPLGEAGQISGALRELLDRQRGPEIGAAAQALVPRNHARIAARELLSLVVPAALLEQGEDELDDALLQQVGGLDISLADLVQMAVDLHDPRREIDRSELVLGPALDLVGEASELGVPRTLLPRLARLLGRRIKTESLDDERLAEHLLSVLRAPAVRGQWSALAMTLDALPGDRTLEPNAFVSRLVRLCNEAGQHGWDLLGLTRLILERESGLEGEPLYDYLGRSLAARSASGNDPSERLRAGVESS